MKPVIIVGMGRTGTTWLSNVLSQNFRLFTPSHFLHYGVKESQLYALNRYYTAAADKQAVMNELAGTDLFRLLNYDKYRVHIASRETYFDIFFDLMDLNARESNTQWFIKLCPDFLYGRPGELKMLLEYLQKRYGGITFITMTRAFEDYLASYINMPGQFKDQRGKALMSFFLTVLAAARYRTLYAEAARQLPTGLTVRYEDMLADTAKVRSRLEEVTGFPYHAASGREFVQNASDRGKPISRGLIGLAWWTTRLHFLNKLLLRAYSEANRKKTPQLYKRMYLFEHDIDGLYRHLEKRGEHKLLDEMKAIHAEHIAKGATVNAADSAVSSGSPGKT